MYRLGIDLGGTKIEGIILDNNLNEIHRKRISTEQEGGYHHILHRVNNLYLNLVKHIDNSPHTFGIGTPGSVSVHTGLLKNSNTVCLNQQPFLSDLEELAERKIA